MRNTSGLLRGGPGRPRGIPNKATRKVKAFLDEVFEEVFARKEFKQRLVESIVDLSIDPKLLSILLAYHVGRPTQAVDHAHSGTVTLAELIVGTIPGDDIDSEV
jgi:hypothetical protein